MTSIAYFELQAKNLFQDYETKIPYVDNVDGNSYYKYDPKHFNVDRIICEYDCDEDNFSQIEAQDIIAIMTGFEKWADLLEASETELECAKLLFDNQDKIHIEDWKMYIASAERDNQLTFDPASRLEIFKLVFINGGIIENPSIQSIAYFKQKAKHLLKAYKTKASNLYQKQGNEDEILMQYGYDKEDFCLMKAQHIIAIMSGFNKWADLLKAPKAEMELAKLLFDNPHKVRLQEWKQYIDATERNTKTTFDPESRLKILKEVFLNKGGFENPFGDYRLDHNLACVTENKKPREVSASNIQITSLPLSETDRTEFIKTANRVFETILLRIAPLNPRQTRELWNAEDYIDNLLTKNMLPISRDYALSLIDAFLVHHVIGLAVKADNLTQ